MRLRKNDASEIDATFHLEASHEVDERVTLVIESAGQSDRADGPRNPAYVELLQELLSRSASVRAVLEDALVASRTVTGLPAEARRIHVQGRPFPIHLRPDEDFAALASGLTRPQADIGSTRVASGGGNRRKRISLTFLLPPETSPDDFVRAIDAVEEGRSRGRESADTLERHHVQAALDRWNAIGTEAFLEEYRTPSDQDYRLVDGEADADATAVLAYARTLAGHQPPATGTRRSVVTPLRNLRFAVLDPSRTSEAPLGDDPKRYLRLAELLGDTDTTMQRIGRREQTYLRGALGIGSADPNASSQCGMCGREFPQSLLVAAHIKPRRLCSNLERLDMPHVGWALCLMGCDALFEQGFLVVDTNGLLRAQRTGAQHPDLRAAIEERAGTSAPGWTPNRVPYFQAHQTHHSTLWDGAPGAPKPTTHVHPSPRGVSRP